MLRWIPVTVILTFLLASTASAQVDLALKYPEGATRRVETTVKARQTLTIAGMEVPTVSENVITTKQVVGKRDAEGNLPLRETVESIRFRLSLPMGITAAFDSSKPDAKHEIPEVQSILEGLKALVGAAYTLTLDDKNRLGSAEGIDEIVKNAPAGGQEFLRERLSVQALQREVNQGREQLPDRPVRKGDRWQRSYAMDLGSGQTLTFETFYEYQGTVQKDGKQLDKVNVFTGGVKYEMAPDSASPLKVTHSNLKIDSSMGSYLFDRESGLVVESSSTNRVSGPMTFSINGMELPGSVNLTLESGSRLLP